MSSATGLCNLVARIAPTDPWSHIVDLIQANTVFEDRLTQLDLRFNKIIRFLAGRNVSRELRNTRPST